MCGVLRNVYVQYLSSVEKYTTTRTDIQSIGYYYAEQKKKNKRTSPGVELDSVSVVGVLKSKRKI